MNRQHTYSRSSSVTKSPPAEGPYCQHEYRICMQDRLEGYSFCIDHILQDKSAPYKPCNFVSSHSGKKCSKAAPKMDKRDGYCRRHARKASMLRYRTSLKGKPKDPGQLVLDELDYYLPNSSQAYPESPKSSVTKLLDYASGSDSDMDLPQLKDVYQGDYDSDAESVDSEPEDALKYAEVYTAEEVALITRDKLIRLQSLYINQFKRLQHLMKEKRREFLDDLKKEIPVFGPDLGQINDPKEKKRLKRLQAMVSYRKRKGHTALLQRKSKDRRIQVTKDYRGPVKAIKLPTCNYQPPGEEEGKCEKPCVPLVLYCMEHILMESDQVLYRRCSKASGVCERITVPYIEGDVCVLHQELPPYTSRLWQQYSLQKKNESLGMIPSGSTSSLESMDASDAAQLFPDSILLPGTSKMIGSPIVANRELEDSLTPSISDDGLMSLGPSETPQGSTSRDSSLADSPMMREVALDSLPLMTDDKPVEEKPPPEVVEPVPSENEPMETHPTVGEPVSSEEKPTLNQTPVEEPEQSSVVGTQGDPTSVCAPAPSTVKYEGAPTPLVERLQGTQESLDAPTRTAAGPQENEPSVGAPVLSVVKRPGDETLEAPVPKVQKQVPNQTRGSSKLEAVVNISDGE